MKVVVVAVVLLVIVVVQVVVAVVVVVVGVVLVVSSWSSRGRVASPIRHKPVSSISVRQTGFVNQVSSIPIRKDISS